MHRMNINSPHNLSAGTVLPGTVLHWVMIVMLMITPLRAVIAGESYCDMEAMDMSHMSHEALMSDTEVTGDASAVPVVGTDIDNKVISAFISTDLPVDMSEKTMSKCCLEGGFSHCNNHCDMSVHFSMLLQPAIFTTESSVISQSDLLNEQPVFRQQSPLLRPPLSILS